MSKFPLKVMKYPRKQVTQYFRLLFKKKRWVTLTDQFQLVHQYSMANLNTIGAKNKKCHQREDSKPANTDIYILFYFIFSSNLEFLFQGLC